MIFEKLYVKTLAKNGEMFDFLTSMFHAIFEIVFIDE